MPKHNLHDFFNRLMDILFFRAGRRSGKLLLKESPSRGATGQFQEHGEDNEISRQSAQHGQADQDSEVNGGHELAGGQDGETDD